MRGLKGHAPKSRWDKAENRRPIATVLRIEPFLIAYYRLSDDRVVRGRALTELKTYFMRGIISADILLHFDIVEGYACDNFGVRIHKKQKTRIVMRKP